MAAHNATYERAGTVAEAVVVQFTGTTGARSENPNVIMGGERNGSGFAPDTYGSVILNPGQSSGGSNNVVGGTGENVGTPNLNTTSLGTNASISVVGGYDNSAGALSSKIISDHSKTLPGSPGHNGIYGGANITMGAAAGFSFATGRRNVVDAVSAAMFGTDNSAKGGASLTSGAFNVNDSNQGVMSGQAGKNRAAYGWIHGHSSETVAGAVHSAARGLYAVARNAGQRAEATQRITETGDCQTSVTHFGGTTTNDTETTLRSGVSVLPWALVRGQAVAVDITVIAKEPATGHVIGAWDVKAVLEWPATGNLAVLQAPVVTTRYVRVEDPVIAPSATVVTASTAGTVTPRVKGIAGRTIAWSARMTTVEIATLQAA